MRPIIAEQRDHQDQPASSAKFLLCKESKSGGKPRQEQVRASLAPDVANQEIEKDDAEQRAIRRRISVGKNIVKFIGGERLHQKAEGNQGRSGGRKKPSAQLEEHEDQTKRDRQSR